MSFGENLKNVRKQRGVTQEELAEILGVSRQAISKIKTHLKFLTLYVDVENIIL